MAPITEAPSARVAAIVVNYRTPAMALECIDALAGERAGLPGFRVVLVDGGSGDGSAERLAEALDRRGDRDWVELLALPINGGFGYANNQALLALAAGPAPPDHVCLVNPDARVLPGSLARLASVLQRHPRAAVVGARLQGVDGTAQGSAFTFPTVTCEFSHGANTEVIRRLTRTPPISLAPAAAARVPWVTGAAAMLRMAALDEVGLFDDGFFLYYEEVELMHRLARAGWEIWHEPDARVEHAGGAATGVRWEEPPSRKVRPLPPYWFRSRRRYYVRTAGRLAASLAAAAFAAGRLVWLLRSTIERKPDRSPQRMTRDTLRHALLPRRSDRLPRRLPRLGDAPGSPPAWMEAERAG